MSKNQTLTAQRMYKLSDHPSIANTFVAELRDVKIQNDRMRFRRNMERIGEVLAYEISKTLGYEEQEVETPLGISKAGVLKDRIVLASILRAAIPFHQGFLNVFDKADNAFVSAYRMHHKDGTFEVKMEYVSCPNLEDSVLVLIDPMLATGASMDITLRSLLEYGQPKAVHIATIIAATSGYNYIRRLHPKAHFWLGDMDDELTARSYIVPGLGDAGDLAFGPKVQD